MTRPENAAMFDNPLTCGYTGIALPVVSPTSTDDLRVFLFQDSRHGARTRTNPIPLGAVDRVDSLDPTHRSRAVTGTPQEVEMARLLWLPLLPVYVIARIERLIADRRERAVRNLIAYQAAVAAEGWRHG